MSQSFFFYFEDAMNYSFVSLYIDEALDLICASCLICVSSRAFADAIESRVGGYWRATVLWRFRLSSRYHLALNYGSFCLLLFSSKSVYAGICNLALLRMFAEGSFVTRSFVYNMNYDFRNEDSDVIPIYLHGEPAVLRAVCQRTW